MYSNPASQGAIRWLYRHGTYSMTTRCNQDLTHENDQGDVEWGKTGPEALPAPWEGRMVQGSAGSKVPVV